MLIHRVAWFLFIWDIHISGSETSDELIVSPSNVQDGGTFTVTCDASRAGVPTTVTTITQLCISWKHRFYDDHSSYATYYTYKNPNNNSYPPDTSPPRNWTFNFSGSQQGTSDIPNNRNTMKIEIMVYDAACTDFGYYSCNATYMDLNNNIETSKYQQQYLSIRTNKIGLAYMSLNPQNQEGYGIYESFNPVGSYVTLKCTVWGPKELSINWKFGNADYDIRHFTPLNGTDALMFGETDPSCMLYMYRSEITFQTEYRYDGYMYVCVVTTNNKELTVGNMTIYTTKAIVNPTVIQEGKKFTVICDASRAGVPTTVSSIDSLSIDWSNGTGDPVTFASNQIHSLPYDVSFLPEKKNWSFAFFRGLNDTSNWNTMKIKILVEEAKCSDAGLYLCTANKYYTYNNSFSLSRNQSVISLSKMSLNL
ncbi:uncharacterized protein LOC131944629 [Physella acuta]|uniref:uncharacterized protein LOC131944629 n=1 Tax=Physella acuta TaxID=109671 RepID=UPI0027DC4D11|nr:uncharacterized protein LOC131944629 [Physella acuta]